MKKERYINPFTDFGFKKLFGEEANKDLLADFLNELLRKEKGDIKTITYLRNEHLPYFGERKAIFDIYCENEAGEKFIVEIQKVKQNFFKDRTVYYSTFPIQDQAILGDWNFRLQAVYTVGILDFVFDDRDKDKTVVSEVKLMDTEKKTVFYDKLTFIYLQMPNFGKTEDELETHFDKWLYVIKNLHRLRERPVKLQERIFEKLFGLAEIEKFGYEERMAYEDSLKVYRDLKNSLDTAKDEGRAEGREEGEKIGIEKGEKIGIEKGEKKKATETANNLLSMGILTMEQVAQATGLTVEDIGLIRISVPKKAEP